MRPIVLFVVNSASFFVSHRLPVARRAAAEGFDVHVAAPAAKEADDVEKEGFTFHAISLGRRSVAPWAELRAIHSLVHLYRDVRPAIVHHITVKPVLYGTIAARLARVPAVVNAITGLGYLFANESPRAAALRNVFVGLGRMALRHPNCRTIFQNTDDLETLVSRALINRDASVVIRGSGVDTREYHPMPQPPGVPLVVLPARMLWDKGVGEFVEAARRLRRRGVAARCALLGRPDPGNPSSIDEEQLRRWSADGDVEWWGHRTDMVAVLAQASIVVLPSKYREGVPKALIEAAACARPIVTTDMPGCRDIVRHGVNGLLVPPGHVDALVEALTELIADPGRRAELGAAGRAIVESEYSADLVAVQTLQLYNAVLQQPATLIAGA